MSLTVVDESLATVGPHGGLEPVRRAEDDVDKPVDEQDEKEIAQFEARALSASLLCFSLPFSTRFSGPHVDP